jgi:hypothetical protein
MSPAQAVSHSYMNRAEIESSEACGCYRCLAVFAPTEIVRWTDSTDPDDEDPGAGRDAHHRFPGYTAVCPFCDDTAVIGSASGAPIEPNFLMVVRDYWSRR